MASEKLERILKLLAELLNSSTPRTAEEIRSKIRMYPDDIVAFRRQFNRDKSALKEMGVPLEVIPVGTSERTAEAYFVDNKAYYLPDLGLTDDELSQLNFAANSIHLIGQISEEEALRKLGGYSQQTPTSGTTGANKAGENVGKNIHVKTLSKTEITIEAQVGEEEKMFGSITALDIHKSLLEKGVEVDRQAILLEEPIKALGIYHVSVRVAPQAEGDVKVYVIKS